MCACGLSVRQVAQVFTGKEGRHVTLPKTIKGFKEILNGDHDDKPEEAFVMVGDIEEVKTKAEALLKKAAEQKNQ